MKKILLGICKTVPALLLYGCGVFLVLAEFWDWSKVLLAAVFGLLSYLVMRTVHPFTARNAAAVMLLLILIANGDLVKCDFYRGEYMPVVYTVAMSVLALMIGLLVCYVFMRKREKKPKEKKARVRSGERLKEDATETERQARRQRRRDERESARQERLLRREQEREFKKYRRGLLEMDTPQTKPEGSPPSALVRDAAAQEDTPWRFSRAERVLAAAGAIVLYLVYFNFADMLFGNPLAYVQAKQAIRDYAAAHYGESGYQPSRVVYDTDGYDRRYYCTMRMPGSVDNFFEINCQWKDETFLGRDVSSMAVNDDYRWQIEWMHSTGDRLERAFRSEVQPLLEMYAADESVYCYIRWDAEELTLDMPCDAKNMPCQTCVELYTDTAAEEALNTAKSLARELMRLQYRIDEYTLRVPGDDGCYYVYALPVQTLVDAESVADLAEYRQVDEYRTPIQPLTYSSPNKYQDKFGAKVGT